MGSNSPSTDKVTHGRDHGDAIAGQPEHQPSPPPSLQASQSNANAFAANTDFPDLLQAAAGASPVFHVRQPSSAGLSIFTGIQNAQPSDALGLAPSSQHGVEAEARPRTSSSLSRPPMATRRSFDSTTNVRSPPSSVSSPMLGSLADVTPLPSPIAPFHSPDPWRRVADRVSRSRGNSAASLARDEALLGPSMLSHSPSRKKKPYTGLIHARDSSGSGQDLLDAAHARTRSTSEYTPETLQNVRPRNVTLPVADVMAAADVRPASSPAEQQPLHREKDFAGRQQKTLESGLLDATKTLPSPPPSDRSTADSEDRNELRDQVGDLVVMIGGKRKQYRPIRRLGNGSFSQVVLAADGGSADLIAIKIVKHDPAARDDERMETSIKREVEMLAKVTHPSLPHMLGFEDTPTRALVALDYCAGGDLFDVATQRRDLLTHTTIQRIFAELVDAVSYLHGLYIVHRDIKLENVLCNISTAALEAVADTRKHASAIITLTDLGLSRHIDPDSPLLTHPCGSTDYAAPELLLGEKYDGRATDAWALGVLLYALLEGRLPFDPLPGKRNTGNVKHRIARCDWLWCTYGDRYGDWVEEKGQGLEGAREVVVGLLKKAGRGRWSVDKVKAHAWVKDGIQVTGGLARSATETL